ncbi:uncharacterized protein KY384_006050 [Bacidia gigantensis]|uniref:uncharacterized protein n=1 Tax=Bacidia gigantensis TaxID=2732470 RepID=UPI001D03764A|nr:uncharacterized protein KY384_006050 [Bacidia gigantensis]KAG8529413.1 hypothetical protein KY384_006050 [Bacidia gigantensis]
MSLLSQLVPLILLFLGVAVAGFIGFVAYSIASDIADKTSKKMEKKNVTFGKEGMKIGVKEVKTENYVDQTQSLLVKAWNFSTWPAYKSRFWNKEDEKGAPTSARPPYVMS